MRIIGFFTLLLICFYAHGDIDAIIEEEIYYTYREDILNARETKFINNNKSLYLDALWDINDEKLLNEESFIKVLDQLSLAEFNLTESTRLWLLHQFHSSSPKNQQAYLNSLVSAIEGHTLDKATLIHLQTYQNYFEKHQDVITQFQQNYPQKLLGVDKDFNQTQQLYQVTQDLFNYDFQLAHYNEGNYKGGIKLFLLCRKNRLYPCLMLMKDKDNKPVYHNDSYLLWSQPALASSANGFPATQRNGDTPMGVYTIDSVMPSPNRQLSFGKYRRLILNFIPSSPAEQLTKDLLPNSSKVHSWWKQASVARDIGRNLLRIHGTGRLNYEPDSLWYPLRRTNGCISKRENSYEFATYHDQKNLLEQMMKAMDLIPQYSNEIKIKGVLYVIDIDDTQEPVTLIDANNLGIF